jgi:hypothetical protein
MNISIPATGYKDGTCGWLAKGLADRSIVIATGRTTKGKHGLWIHHGDDQGCLALFNEFDLDRREFHDAHTFRPCEEGFAGDFPLTSACETYLREIAQEWCDAANAARESDSEAVMPQLVVAKS